MFSSGRPILILRKKFSVDPIVHILGDTFCVIQTIKRLVPTLLIVAYISCMGNTVDMKSLIVDLSQMVDKHDPNATSPRLVNK